MTTARLAKEMGLTILATTRNSNKRDKLKANGVDHVIIDEGDVFGQVDRLCGRSQQPIQDSMQAFVDEVASGHQWLTLDNIFKLKELAEAHRYMESNQANGKVVVVIE